MNIKEDEGELNDKLFENNDEGGNGAEEQDDERTQEIIGCDACGEFVEDVDIPLEMTTIRIIAEQTRTEGYGHDDEPRAVGMNQTFKILTPEERELRRQERENKTLARAAEKELREALRIETRNNKEMARVEERKRLEALTNITHSQKKRKLRLENSCGKSVYLKYQNLLYKDNPAALVCSGQPETAVLLYPKGWMQQLEAHPHGSRWQKENDRRYHF